jgi:hypothetical protein
MFLVIKLFSAEKKSENLCHPQTSGRNMIRMTSRAAREPLTEQNHHRI